MARDMQGGQRGSSRNGSGSSRTRGRADASRGSRPSRGSGRQQSRRGTLTQPDTGYRLHSRRVSYPNGSGSPLSFLLRPRVLLLIAILVLVIVALVVGVSSCVRGNKERATQAAEQAKPVNEQDSRVAAGVSAATTSKFTEVLDQNELLEKIAQQANEYDDERLLDLSLREPTSRQFVADYPSSDKSSRPYTDTIKQGEVPRLFDWDSRWGAVTYGNGPLAITGSGPTTLAMAYMGLTGKTDFSPTEIAQQASKSNYTNDESGSKGELFAKLATSMGLKSEQHDPSAETILYSLGDNTVFAVELKPNTLTDEAHWALLVNINEDGMLTVFDPTSTEVSNKTWGLDTIAGASSNLYSITLSDEAIAALEKNASGTTSTGTGTSTGTTTDTDTDTGLSTNTGTGTSTGTGTGTSTGTGTGTSTGTGTGTSTGTSTGTGTGTSTSTGTGTSTGTTTGTTTNSTYDTTDTTYDTYGY